MCVYINCYKNNARNEQKTANYGLVTVGKEADLVY